MASPIAHFVVSLGSDGRVVSQGHISEALARDKNLLKETAENMKGLEKADEEIDATEAKVKGDGKLMVAEEIQEGHVSWKSLKLFFTGLGGDHPLIFWVVFLVGMFLTDFINTIQTWWLGHWANQYDKHSVDPSQVAVPL